jgi:hypothetical protein
MDSTIKTPVSVRRLVSQKLSGVAILAIFILLCCPPSDRAEEEFTPEYKIKAGFIYNFAKFVDWPTNAFAAVDSPFVIGVLGEDPFGKLLDQAVQNRNVGGRRIEVRRFSQIEEAQTSHVLFISRSESEHITMILKRLKGKNILTVGETPGFLEEGGVINLVVEQMSVRFQINADAAESAHLLISSKLLGLAAVVRQGYADGGR